MARKPIQIDGDALLQDAKQIKRIKAAEAKVRKLESDLLLLKEEAKVTSSKLKKAVAALRNEIRQDTPELPFPDGDDEDGEKEGFVE